MYMYIIRYKQLCNNYSLSLSHPPSLISENSDTSDLYTVYTSVPESLPFADLEGKPSSNGVTIKLGEVCFA